MSAAKPMVRLPRTRGADVAERIKAYIVSEQLRPGDPLPTENELITAVAASRTSVREAIKSLAALDIVVVRHGHGSFVGGMSMRALVDSLAFRGLLSTGTDSKVMTDVVNVRQMLEQGLAPLMLQTLSPRDIEALRGLAREMIDRAQSAQSYLEPDRKFHITLMQAIGNELVVQLTAAFWEVQARVAPDPPVDEDARMATAEAHLEIVEALAAHDLARLIAAFSQHYEPLRAHVATLSPAPITTSPDTYR